MSPRHRLLAVLVNFVFGINFPITKMGLAGMPPFFFCFIRFAILAAILSPFLRIIPGKMKQLALIGVIMGIAHYAFVYTGAARLGDGGSGAIIIQTQMVFSVLLAAAFLHERPRPQQWAGIGLAFAGVLVFGFDPRVLSYHTAVLLIVGAALMQAITQILMRGLIGVTMPQQQAWSALIGAPGLLALSLAFEQGQVASVTQISGAAIFATVFTIFGTSLIGHGGNYFLFTRYRVADIAPFMPLSPIFGLASGALLMGDQLTARMIAGGLVTVLGVAVVNIDFGRMTRARAS